MSDYMSKELKWTSKELHDAVVIAGISAPDTPSMVNCINSLEMNKQASFRKTYRATPNGEYRISSAA